jgi:Skp family chaperone for outer membrane proteins
VKRTNWIPLVVVFLTLGLAGYVVAVVSAQNSGAAAPPRPYQVAIVDIAQLIKNHPNFIAKQKELQDFAKSKEAEFNKRKLDLSEREKTLNAHNLVPGTKEHDDAVNEITTSVTTLEKDVKIAQRKLMQDNSIILHAVYKEIREEIGLIAKQARIAQVMDYRTFDANPADPNAVATMLEQNLIWYDEDLDISQAIVNRLYSKRKITANIPNLKLLRDQKPNTEPTINGIGGTAPARSTQPTIGAGGAPTNSGLR